MPATMPESVTIGPHVYSIARSTNMVNAKQVALQRAVYGYCDEGLRQIVIDEESVLSGSMTREVVLHECLHALMDSSGLSYGIGHEKLVYSEEALLQVLDTALLAMLRANPALVAWLTSED